MQFTCVYFCTKAIYPEALEKKQPCQEPSWELSVFPQKKAQMAHSARQAVGACAQSAQHMREHARVGGGCEGAEPSLLSLAVRVCVCLQLRVGLCRFVFAIQ